MTNAAREVLNDCRDALRDFTDDVQGPAWRRRWLMAVVLLRAVGHVLHKVDGEADDISSRTHETIKDWWAALNATKPKPEIFWLFIEEERNSMLKVYKTAAGQGVTVGLIGAAAHAGAGGFFGLPHQVCSAPNQAGIAGPTDRVRIQNHYNMNSGHFKGREQRELITEAIDWWQSQLDAIDCTIGKHVTGAL